jgi:hypothetical protein
VGYGLAEIAHFAVQGREAYLMRGDRGNVNLKPEKYDTTYFAVFDRNEVALPGLASRAPRIAAQVADWLTDPELRGLHTASCDWHAQRLATLRASPSFAARMEALARAADTPIPALDDMLFIQPLSPAGKALVDRMRAAGLPDREIAHRIAARVAELEAERDAREAHELRAMGVRP